MDAVGDSVEEQLRKLPGVIKAWETGMYRGVFPEHLGYLTYVCAYTDALRAIDGLEALVRWA
jgi:hypothetical protein